MSVKLASSKKPATKSAVKSTGRRTKAEQSSETRALFVRVARHLFAQQGYANTSTDEILAQTQVTRGALYHQFKNKADLLRAVCEQMQTEIHQEILVAANAATDAFESVLVGCDAFLAAAAKPDVQQVLLIDAPAVLGWEEWNRLDRQHGFGLLLEGVSAAIARGQLQTHSPEVFATMLNGAMNEGILWAVQGENILARLDEVRMVLHQLLNGLRSHPSRSR